jgi:hypothetical protein
MDPVIFSRVRKLSQLIAYAVPSTQEKFVRLGKLAAFSYGFYLKKTLLMMDSKAHELRSTREQVKNRAQ